MRASHELTRVAVSYDESNLMSAAGLLPAAALTQKLGLAELIDARLRLARHGANSATKALTVIGSMLAGGDSIDDVALLDVGAGRALFDGYRAPSTIGTWLRDFRWSNARQLDAVTRELLARLWAAGAGPDDPAGPLTIDLDSTICEVRGRDKQGAGFGYTKRRGYHPQLATCAETGQVIFSRLRGRAAAAARGADSLLAESVSRLRGAGANGPLTVRVDPGVDSLMVSTARRLDVRFSITTRQDRRVRRAIAGVITTRPGLRSPTGSPPRRSPRRRRRSALHLLLRPRRGHRPADRAPGPPDPGHRAGAVHDLQLPRHDHRPGR